MTAHDPDQSPDAQRQRRNAYMRNFTARPESNHRAVQAAYRKTPNGVVRQRAKMRRQNAKRDGYLPPPDEHDCPPRPVDGCCQHCSTFIGHDQLWMDHDHETGQFREWVCPKCNAAPELRSGSINPRPAFFEMPVDLPRRPG